MLGLREAAITDSVEESYRPKDSDSDDEAVLWVPESYLITNTEACKKDSDGKIETTDDEQRFSHFSPSQDVSLCYQCRDRLTPSHSESHATELPTR